jgi:hypothetical protein
MPCNPAMEARFTIDPPEPPSIALICVTAAVSSIDSHGIVSSRRKGDRVIHLVLNAPEHSQYVCVNHRPKVFCRALMERVRTLAR